MRQESCDRTGRDFSNMMVSSERSKEGRKEA